MTGDLQNGRLLWCAVIKRMELLMIFCRGLSVGFQNLQPPLPPSGLLLGAEAPVITPNNRTFVCLVFFLTYRGTSNSNTRRLLLRCRFVELVEELVQQGSLHRLGIVPLMCACGTSPYALDLVARLQAAAPSAVVHSHFLGPHRLAEVRCMFGTCGGCYHQCR